MAYYLVEVAYSTEGWRTLIKKPEDRSKAVGRAIKKMGGKLEGFWFSFGERDVITIIQMPGNVESAAFALAVAASGAVKSLKTTPLLTVKEGMAALRKASKTSYTPPGMK